MEIEIRDLLIIGIIIILALSIGTAFGYNFYETTTGKDLKMEIYKTAQDANNINCEKECLADKEERTRLEKLVITIEKDTNTTIEALKTTTLKCYWATQFLAYKEQAIEHFGTDYTDDYIKECDIYAYENKTLIWGEEQ